MINFPFSSDRLNFSIVTLIGGFSLGSALYYGTADFSAAGLVAIYGAVALFVRTLNRCQNDII